MPRRTLSTTPNQDTSHASMPTCLPMHPPPGLYRCTSTHDATQRLSLPIIQVPHITPPHLSCSRPRSQNPCVVAPTRVQISQASLNPPIILLPLPAQLTHSDAIAHPSTIHIPAPQRLSHTTIHCSYISPPINSSSITKSEATRLDPVAFFSGGSSPPPPPPAPPRGLLINHLFFS